MAKNNKAGKGQTQTAAQDIAAQLDLKPGQSIELLKALHILTRDGKLNQDSRRKLKQVYHLYQFIEPILKELGENDHAVTLADHGAGKSSSCMTCTSRRRARAASTALKPAHHWWKPRRSWPQTWALSACIS